MANTYERLVAAGAPAIVEPLFYRIHQNVEGSLRVEVRERSAYKGSSLKASRTVQAGSPSEVFSDVILALQELVEDLELKDAIGDLVGDHFPEEAGK